MKPIYPLLSMVVAAPLVGCTSRSNPQTEERMNILYIMTDDHAFQAISAYGHQLSGLAPTPNLDRLAKMGMLFQHAYVENSLSTPSRACLMTGLYSHQNGQTMLSNQIDSTVTFIPELMHQAGYQTAVIGKWHMLCEPRGFDTYRVLRDQGEYYNPVFKSAETNGEYVTEEGYATDLITKHAIEFLDNRDQNKPFLLYVHHKAPHRPWMPDFKYLTLYDNVDFPMPETFHDDYATRGAATKEQRMTIDKDMSMIYDLKLFGVTGFPEEFQHYYDTDRMIDYATGSMKPEEKEKWLDAYAQRNKDFVENFKNWSHDDIVKWKFQRYVRDYLAVIKSVDDSVGELLDYLEKHDLMKNTMIVYTSDQGFYMGEHGWFDKRFMYEESFRTPLIVRYPGNKGGVQSQALVQNLDFGPTFLDIAGVQQPENMYGQSMLPVLKKNGKEPDNWRETLYYHFYDHTAEHNVLRHDGVFGRRYKLIHFYDETGAIPSYEEFYDLEKDPNELNNLIGNQEYKSIIDEYMQRLTDKRKEVGVTEY